MADRISFSVPISPFSREISISAFSYEQIRRFFIPQSPEQFRHYWELPPMNPILKYFSKVGAPCDNSLNAEILRGLISLLLDRYLARLAANKEKYGDNCLDVAAFKQKWGVAIFSKLGVGATPEFLAWADRHLDLFLFKIGAVDEAGSPQQFTSLDDFALKWHVESREFLKLCRAAKGLDVSRISWRLPKVTPYLLAILDRALHLALKQKERERALSTL
jgi:hypothetical protein